MKIGKNGTLDFLNMPCCVQDEQSQESKKIDDDLRREQQTLRKQVLLFDQIKTGAPLRFILSMGSYND